MFLPFDVRYESSINTEKNRIEFFHRPSRQAFYISYDFIRSSTNEELNACVKARIEIEDNKD